MAEKLARAKDLRQQPVPELQEQLQKLRQELWQHRLHAREGSLKQTHLIPSMRRQMARLRTVIKERT